jgi:hypothetical protein
MRALLAVAFVAVLALLTVHAASQPKLTPEPMRIEKVKDNLYVIRGPFNVCAPNGCGRNSVDDGLLHEAGWNHTVSTGTFMRSIGQYYDEVAAVK